MNDQQIIDLYFARNEQAIVETDRQYGAACMRISLNILNSRPDAEECVSDTYLSVWNNIPPERPHHLGAYICRIARNLSLRRFRDLHRQRRDRDLEVAMDDLAVIAAPPEDRAAELAQDISNFLDTQDKLDRLLFMGRYFHLCSVKELAAQSELAPNTVSVRLHRTREKLRVYLLERGYQP